MNPQFSVNGLCAMAACYLDAGIGSLVEGQSDDFTSVYIPAGGGVDIIVRFTTDYEIKDVLFGGHSLDRFGIPDKSRNELKPSLCSFLRNSKEWKERKIEADIMGAIDRIWQDRKSAEFLKSKGFK